MLQVAAFLLLSPSLLEVQPSPKGTERPQDLIVLLGHAQYRVREEAAKKLIQMGADAKAALEAGLKHTDLEISDRCRKLLPLALEHYYTEQIERFVNNPNAKLPNDLPGLTRWLEIAGNDRESRLLYRDMLLKQSRFLIEAEKNRQRLSDQYLEFLRAVYDRNRNPNQPGIVISTTTTMGVELHEILLFLFAGTYPNVNKNDARTINAYAYSNTFLNSNYLKDGLSGKSANSQVLKKLFVHWLGKQENINIQRRAFQLAAQVQLKEAVPVVIKAATEKGATPLTRSYAITSLLGMATKEDIAKLEPLLEEKVTISRATSYSTELRDVALGVIVELAGQKPIDFGFERVRPANTTGYISYIYFSFSTDEKREAAHKKWKEWWALNKEKTLKEGTPPAKK